MRNMTPEEIERRRAAIRKKRKKKIRMRILLAVLTMAVVILVVVLIVYGISSIVKHSNGDEQAVQSESESPVSTEETTTEPEETILQEAVNNTQIDLTSLSTESIKWGVGPARDELNRPIDAIALQEKYGDYSAYFILTGTEDKVIYLTMDEGYEYGFTETILDVLLETDTQIVFFVTKPFAESNPDLVQRMIDEGHIVGSHSVTHPSEGMPGLTVEEQQNEITELHEYVQENFNYTMWLFRPPTGAFSEQSLAVVNNLDYISVLWSFAYYDYDTENQPDTQEALQKCLDSLHPGAIYLLHAVSETNTAILKDFINGAKERGYTFELIPARPAAQETISALPDSGKCFAAAAFSNTSGNAFCFTM